MSAVAALVVGALFGAAAWAGLRSTLQAPLFDRANYRDHHLPTAAGIAVVLAVLAGEGVFSLLTVATSRALGDDLGRFRVLLAVAGYGALGLLDDLAGDGDSRGFAGHLRAVRDGRLTTGAVKLLSGGALAVALASPYARNLFDLVRDAALIALCANLGNLFDRAPGRTTKVGAVAFLLLLALTGATDELTGAALAVGACLALLVPDLREEAMLGDTGANVLGAVVGLGVLLACTPTTRLVVLLVVAALNAASEVVSFSKVIDQVAVLRFLDRAGARPERRQPPPA